MSKLAPVLKYAIWVGLLFLDIFVLQRLTWFGCPQDAFICGSAGINTWARLVRVVLLVGFTAYPAKIAYYFATRNRLLRSAFDREHKQFDLRKASLRAVLVAALTLPAIYLLTVEKVWASSKEIAEQDYVWSTVVKRTWSEVVAVSTSCKPSGRGASKTGYHLIFRDGGHVNLASNAGPITDHQVEIFAALHGRQFAFDSSAVDERCISEFREMATRRP